MAAVAANAQPSWSASTSQAAAIAARTAMTWSGARSTPWPEITWVQMTNPRTIAAAGQATRRATAAGAACTSPVVLSIRNVAPCSRHSASMVTPVASP